MPSFRGLGRAILFLVFTALIFGLLLGKTLFADEIPQSCFTDWSKGPSDECHQQQLRRLKEKRTCLVTHILECDEKGCLIMCADGVKCRKDGYPIKWATEVECVI